MRKVIAGAAGGIAALLTMATTVSANGYNYDYSDYIASQSAASGVGLAGAGVGLVVWCCVALVLLMVPIVLAVIVYKDAMKNKVENAILWALLTFFFNIIGLLVYFLAIKPEAVKKNGGGESKSEHKPESNS